MSKELSHEAIARQFVERQAFDFGAIGSLVTELAPKLAVSDHGLHGVLIGRFNVIACMLTAVDAASLIGNVRVPGLAQTLLQGGRAAE